VQAPKLITATTSDSLTCAFQKLCENKILAIPVVDTTGTPKGIVSVIDIICYLNDKFDEESLKGSIKHTFDFFSLVITKREISDKSIATLGEIGEYDPIVMIDDDKNLSDVIHLMVNQGSRRVLIQSRESQSLIGLVTQTSLLKFLWDSSKDELKTSFWDTKISDIPNLAAKREVVTVKSTDAAYTAFKKMKTNGISAVGVVDDSGKLVGNISASDVKLLGFNLDYFQALAFTATEYLQTVREKSGAVEEVVSIREGGSDTVGVVVQKLLDKCIHRLYIVDSQDKPVSVISLTNILANLVDTTYPSSTS